MTYEAWRITYQSAEQAARAAYQEWQRAIACKGCPVQQGTHVPMGTVVHPDDLAVDALAAAMKAKLARQRAKGYGGWDTDCTQQRLSDLLRGHVDKGDPVDVANFCAFLLARGEGIAAAQQGVQPFCWFFIKSQLPGDYEFTRDGERANEARKYGYKPVPLFTHPTTQGLERQQVDPLRQMLAQHQAHLEQSPYAYFELAYTRQTGWMVWITDKPAFRESELVNPDRKVLWQGQGETPDEACENATLAAQAKQAGV